MLLVAALVLLSSGCGEANHTPAAVEESFEAERVPLVEAERLPLADASRGAAMPAVFVPADDANRQINGVVVFADVSDAERYADLGARLTRDAAAPELEGWTVIRESNVIVVMTSERDAMTDARVRRALERLE